MKTYDFILLILHIIPMGAWIFLLFITKDENKNHIASIFPLWLNFVVVMIAMALLPLLIWSFNLAFIQFLSLSWRLAMLWFTLFLLCIALEIITGTGWLLLISLGALSSAIVGFFSSDITRSQYMLLCINQHTGVDN
ncbi:NfeD family protein [Escherichia coli]|uniref:NfeD family protein n=1 Tax=Escherichia coli TaxID=562 RepID=UPI0038903762